MKSMLEFEDGEKFQESFMVNFEVSYLDMFGEEHRHELKEKGKATAVTMDNKQVRAHHMISHMTTYEDCITGVCGLVYGLASQLEHSEEVQGIQAGF